MKLLRGAVREQNITRTVATGGHENLARAEGALASNRAS